MRAQFGGTGVNISIYDDETFRLAPRLECEIDKVDGSKCKLEVLIVDSLNAKDKMFPNNLSYQRYFSSNGDLNFRRADRIIVEITYELLESIVNGKTDEERTYMTRVSQGDRLHISYVDLS